MFNSGTAAAFTSDSFVIDTDPYLFERIQASSFSLRDTSTYAVESTSSVSSSNSISLNSAFPVMTDPPGGTLIGTYDAGLFEGQSYTSNVSLDFPDFISNSSYVVSKVNYVVPDINNVSWDSFVFPDYYYLSYDVSSLNSSSLEFSGVFNTLVQVANKSLAKTVSYQLKIYIDGALQREYRSADTEIEVVSGIIKKVTSETAEVPL